MEYYSSGSLVVKFNPFRTIHRKLLETKKIKPGPVSPADRHGNSIHPNQLTADITQAYLKDLVLHEVLRMRDFAEERFERIISEAIDYPGLLSVEVFWFSLQLACDRPVVNTGEIVSSFYPFFRRNFKYVQEESKDPETPHFIAGRNFKYPRVVVYGKKDLVRFEIEVDPERIKQAVGSHRVPFNLDGLRKQLDAVWMRHAVSVIREMETDLGADSWTPDVIALLVACPGFKNRKPLESALVDLTGKGWIQVTASNRSVLDFLRSQGLVVKSLAPGRYKLAPGLDLSQWKGRPELIDSVRESRPIFQVRDIGVLSQLDQEVAENA